MRHGVHADVSAVWLRFDEMDDEATRQSGQLCEVTGFVDGVPDEVVPHSGAAFDARDEEHQAHYEDEDRCDECTDVYLGVMWVNLLPLPSLSSNVPDRIKDAYPVFDLLSSTRELRKLYRQLQLLVLRTHSIFWKRLTTLN